jgi:rhodanese-related sulfurtransferase
MNRRHLALTVHGLVLAPLLGLAGPAAALEVNLTETRPYVEVEVRGETVRIQRDQDTDAVLTGFFAKTSRPCPPFCIHAMSAAPGVETVGEVEIFDFMTGPMRNGNGLLVDGRTPDWFERRTIPGSVNIPWTTLAEADPTNAEFLRLLEAMGVREGGGGGLLQSLSGLFGGGGNSSQWDFSRAKELVLFCNGPWCDQSPRAIKGLLKIGYPADKLKYYRGGMTMWELLGLTTIPGTEQD